MRILLLSVEFPPGPGGMGIYAYQIASYLNRSSWEVTVCSPQAHARLDEIQRFNAAQSFTTVTFPRLGPFWREAADRLGKTLREIRGSRPDLILAIGYQAVWLGACARLLTGVPLAAAGLGSEFIARNPIDLRLTRWAYGLARLVIFISRFTQSLAESNGFRFHRSIVIPPGADESLYRPGLPVQALRERLNLGLRRIILTVGQLSERKAQDIVIRALPEVLKMFPDVLYVMAGLPTRQAELEGLARKLDVLDHVLFTGVVPQAELPLYYNLAELFVLTSRQVQKGEVEGFGIVVVEAALCGLPAIVTEGTGLVEAVRTGETALVVPQEDPQAVAQAVIRLLTDPLLRQRMGQAARQVAQEEATWQKRLQAVRHALQVEFGGEE